jgi:putative flippase GtrA
VPFVESAFGQKMSIFRQWLKFMAVGAVNASFGFVVYASLIAMGLHFATATAVSTVAGIAFNFKTTGGLVFQSRDNRKIWRFLLVYFTVYLFNVIGIAVFEKMGVSSLIGGAILVVPSAVVVFFLCRWFVFVNR